MTKRSFITAIFVLLAGIFASAQTVIHVGAFPNITHSQAMVGKANGWFAKRMGPKVTIDSATLMNKGLEVIEAYHLFDLKPSETTSSRRSLIYVACDAARLRI